MSNTEVEQQEIVATTWGWSKIVSKPIRIVTTNKEDRIFFSQVKFGIGDGPINTALITKVFFGFSDLENWKIGDEVLITQIPGTVGDVPSPTFIVIDHRSQEQKK